MGFFGKVWNKPKLEEPTRIYQVRTGALVGHLRGLTEGDVRKRILNVYTVDKRRLELRVKLLKISPELNNWRHDQVYVLFTDRATWELRTIPQFVPLSDKTAVQA